MTHWYGWIALGVAVASATDHGRSLVTSAWHAPCSPNGSRYAPSVLWFAVYVTAAVALVMP